MSNIETEKLGDVCQSLTTIPFDEYRYVLNEHGMRTSYVRKSRNRTIGEVFGDLTKFLDVAICTKRCGFTCKPPVGAYSWVDSKCPSCGKGEMEPFIDEYISSSYRRDNKDKELPDIDWPCAWPVIGGSEGHYVHIGGVIRATAKKHPEYFEIALVKTFGGWERAQEIANYACKLMWH